MSKAPYRHADGSDCYTRNCSRGHATPTDIAILNNNFDAYIAAKEKENAGKTFIHAIASREEFDEMVKKRLIFKQSHPEYPYSIYKYSQNATYSKSWNEITLAARGLIIHDETDEILARPFPKFFNYNEESVPTHLLKGEIHVTEKLDGSLGISFINPNGDLEISTAGGFQSEQAAHANKIYNERYKGKWEPVEGRTYMWEIIYPENRIVVDYGDEDDIHLLGAVDIATGRTIPVSEVTEWKWKKAKTYDGFQSIDKVINSPGRQNAEGYIVHYVETDVRVKYKHEEYVKVHRIATGLNERSIYDMLSSGGKHKLEEYKSQAPEEFETYINNVTDKLETQYQNKLNNIHNVYKSLLESLPKNADQKTFAIKVRTTVPKEYASHMFSLHSGKGVVEKKIWESIKPEYKRGIWSTTNGVKK